LGDDVFQFHTPPRYATGLDIRCPLEIISKSCMMGRRVIKPPP
jgi:hypothetical protein